jgi:hypothetical protein
MTNVRKILLLSVLASIILPIGFISGREYRRRTLDAGFNSIKNGDSRVKVIEVMGTPDQEETCRYNEDCKYRYLYYSFMERWGVEFDNNYLVLGSFKNEGSF